MRKRFLLLLAATLASASGWATSLEVGERIEYGDLIFRVISTSENEDKDIVVYFDEKDGGIDEAGAQDVSVRGADGAILVEGLGQDATVNVYNTSGQLVYSGNDSVINMVSGVYVIEISGKVYKTVVR